VLCGGLSGAVGQGLVYPLDTVRTRLAVCSKSEYTGIAVQAAKMWCAGGIPCFYRGLVPSTVSGSVEGWDGSADTQAKGWW
jgi:solute carrier family 25 phosphate transporter 23/24/25/41